MSVCKFIQKLLHLKGLLVSDFQFKFRHKQLNLWVKQATIDRLVHHGTLVQIKATAIGQNDIHYH